MKVFELSAVKSLTSRGDEKVLSFAGGTIVAKRVVFCTNAYAATFGGHANGLLPVYTFVSMSRVMNADEIGRLGGRNSWALIPVDPIGTRRFAGSPPTAPACEITLCLGRTSRWRKPI